MRFLAEDTTIAEVPLFAAEDIAESGVIDKAIDTLSFMALGG